MGFNASLTALCTEYGKLNGSALGSKGGSA